MLFIKYLISVGLLIIAAPLWAQSAEPAVYGSWWSILPPLVAIALALVVKRVIPSLLVGVFLGAWLVAGLNLGGFWQGILDTGQVYILNAMADSDHAAVILFSMMIGGMVGIIARNGGILGMVDGIVTWAHNVRRASLGTAAMGMAVFFDDYANTLVVGNTMRPITDRLSISREKLAYLVDSTAAPVSCLALVTTWIGYEVGLIGDATEKIAGLNEPAYSLFLNSLLYSFYPILALVFVLMIAYTGRDFGHMLKAERRARRDGVVIPDAMTESEIEDDLAAIEPPQDKPRRAINAVVPVLALVFGVMGGIYATGEGNSLREIVNTSDSYKALVWGSFLGVLAAALMSLTQRILTLEQTVSAWVRGLKSMLFAIIVLVLAWALSATTSALGTDQFVESLLGDRLPVEWLPTLTFIMAAGTAFATGSAWGTMGILMPLVVPLAWALMGGAPGAEPNMMILYSTIASVLAGAVWGDHCSPISDTTILSSMASGCDHIEHVRTQLPYALSVGFCAILFGTLGTAYGLPWWAALIIGGTALLLLLRLLGKTTEQHPQPAPDSAPAT